MTGWLTGGLLVLLLLVVLFPLIIHLGFRAPRTIEADTPEAIGLPFRQVWIPTVADKQLFGWLLPADGADETLVILHGWGGNAELMLPLAAPFHAQGINVLLFDTRNHGNSDAHSFSSLPRFAEDLDHALDWLCNEHPELSRKVGILGHSVGAGAVLLAASRRHDITAVITIAAFAHPEWVMRRYLSYLPALLVGLINRYVQWVIGHRFAAIAPMNTVCRVACPVLLVHGLADELVPVSDAHAIVAHCPRDNLTLLEIADAGHSSVEKVEQHGGQLVEFLRCSGFVGDGRNG